MDCFRCRCRSCRAWFKKSSDLAHHLENSSRSCLAAYGEEQTAHLEEWFIIRDTAYISRRGSRSRSALWGIELTCGCTRLIKEFATVAEARAYCAERAGTKTKIPLLAET